ncbi:MAG: Tim44-like domain-containing protein [Methylomonas sp.]|jgi:predicted lipid-binding transport protein (Tim44 family)|uniref:Tim44 domain-containing protein n=1 Tax=Methylomonas sp. TaxID=418 RepID=UPI0025D89AAB|nr:Tim44-like domain-containing protein [Methylomonas sp.]MCK9605452.1 Tim44-like domain-containing protein [Methylomonas sp.]
MNTKLRILASIFFTLTLLMAGIQEAQAKRFGGGGSFGSRPNFSAPYKRSTSPAASQPVRSASQQQAAAKNQAARQSWAGRGGLMGMLGGLALGGLLGSLFFGGAFENINFMDILVFAGIAYLLMRLFASKARQSQPSADTAYGRNSNSDQNRATGFNSPPTEDSSKTGFNTDLLFGKNASANAAGFNAPAFDVPADFDQAAFLAGAESAFRYLQSAWDSADLAAIRGLTTDKVFAEIQDQLKASGASNKTEVLKVMPELLEIREAGNELEAVVLFDCIMREDESDTEQVREVWHFIKPINSKQSKWFLDGIQQLEI